MSFSFMLQFISDLPSHLSDWKWTLHFLIVFCVYLDSRALLRTPGCSLFNLCGSSLSCRNTTQHNESNSPPPNDQTQWDSSYLKGDFLKMMHATVSHCLYSLFSANTKKRHGTVEFKMEAPDLHVTLGCIICAFVFTIEDHFGNKRFNSSFQVISSGCTLYIILYMFVTPNKLISIQYITAQNQAVTW